MHDVEWSKYLFFPVDSTKNFLKTLKHASHQEEMAEWRQPEIVESTTQAEFVSELVFPYQKPGMK